MSILGEKCERCGKRTKDTFNDLPTCVCLKHEDWPGLEKITALRKAGALDRPLSILCGNGGIFLPEMFKLFMDPAAATALGSSLASMAIFPLVMLIAYILLILYFKSKGGYKQVHLGDADEVHPGTEA